MALALVPISSRLKTYRDAIAQAERQRHEEARRAAEEEARCAAGEAEEHRAAAEQLAANARDFDERQRAAEELHLAEEAAERAEIAARQAGAPLEPTRIHGDYGAIAYVTRSWTFEIIDLDRVPRQYLRLDVEAVRAAIARDQVRKIPGLRIFQSESLRVRGVI